MLVDETGRIAALGPESTVLSPPSAVELDLGRSVVLPGLVNVHTHLELTDLRGEIDELDFFAWIQRVRAAKEGMRDEQFMEAAREGVREAWSHGITTVADTGTSGASAIALAEMGGRGLYYQEAIAPDPELCDEAFTALIAMVGSLADRVPEEVEVGVSPHAPYTVSAQLYARVADYARAEGRKLAAHLAESHGEVELITQGTGKFAQAWQERGIPAPQRARTPLEYVRRLGLLGSDLLAIHAVQADEQDIELLAGNDVSVAVCPRSNARHRHGTPPLAAFLNAGLRCGLGTDSVASVDSLDLLGEAAEARELAGLSHAEVIALLTLGGAAALGWQRSLGSLEPGKWADMCVLDITSPVPHDPEDLARAILCAGSSAIRSTYIAGRMVHSVRDRPGADRDVRL